MHTLSHAALPAAFQALQKCVPVLAGAVSTSGIQLGLHGSQASVPIAHSLQSQTVDTYPARRSYSSKSFSSSSNLSSSSSQLPLDQALRQPLNFNDYESIFRQRSARELLRTYVVLKVCSITPLVRHADTLVKISRKLLGDTITFGVMRHTFMKQFCAGETENDLWPAMKFLRDNGIGAIIDYAAEDDVPQTATGSSQPSPTSATTDGEGSDSSTGVAAANAGQEPADAGVAVGRTYSYVTEAVCDKHVGVFLKAVETVAKLPGQGFAAIKMTALGNPQLLERMSAALLEIRTLFKEADSDGDGFVTFAEFEQLYRQLFPNPRPDEVRRRFDEIDLEGNGRVDIISWSHRIYLAHMPAMVERIKKRGSKSRISHELCSVALTKEEVALVDALLARVAKLASAAAVSGVKLMIDAEHTYFQPAIDHTTHVLSLHYNKAEPVIFNTYQAYLKGSYERIAEDMERARREKYIFAAKLVRGAYVSLERARAAKLGYESPIWDNIQLTHDNYNRCLDAVLDEVSAQQAQVMVASHNQDSVERTVAGMASRSLSPSGSGVYFGQLLGMSDNLSFTLGQNGYEAFKYVPYGPIELVMPYLIRRAHENSAIMGAAVTKQLEMLKLELLRRMKNPLARGGLLKRSNGSAIPHSA